MGLNASVAVTSSRGLAISARPASRAYNVQNLGAGTLYYQIVSKGAASNLTTGNGTQITGSAVTNIQITPLGANEPTGTDLYLISGTSTTASCQTVPI